MIKILILQKANQLSNGGRACNTIHDVPGTIKGETRKGEEGGGEKEKKIVTVLEMIGCHQWTRNVQQFLKERKQIEPDLTYLNKPQPKEKTPVQDTYR